MAGKPRKMAKLNNDSSLPFAAAVTAMSIGTGKRLIRNFQYYRQKESQSVSRTDCKRVFRDIRLNVFGLQNLYLDHHSGPDSGSSSFKVMLAKQIQDGFEELHRSLLFFEGDQIAGLIPVIDEQRAFWAGSSEPEFYTAELPATLDRQLTTHYPQIENALNALPPHSSL